MNAKIFKGLGLNIVLLGLVSLLTDISSEMVFSALPFFIASLGGGGVAVGLIGGLAESISSLLKIFSGYWSDRLRKTKPFIFWGYFTSSLMKLFFPLVQSWPGFLLCSSLFSTPAGILSDKIGRRKVLTAGYLIYGLNCLGFVFSHSLFSFILLFALYGLSFALIEGNQRALASDLVEEEIRGTALGSFHLLISIAALLAGLLAGLLWNWNPKAPFIYAAILSLSAGVGINLKNPLIGNE
ncbi:MAG: MFS transporter [Elusimicrobiota bacterium]